MNNPTITPSRPKSAPFCTMFAPLAHELSDIVMMISDWEQLQMCQKLQVESYFFLLATLAFPGNKLIKD
ncbi:MAG: hypothetical protein DWQ04_34730 [Chloroflexi bacterium]|nr:MAG: hypothetical protein DWQ04_34730 [Chloroflexota bacterium]